MLVPSLLFASTYAAGAASGPRSERYGQPPGDWGVTIVVSHPAYVVSGTHASVTLTLGIQVANGNDTVEVSDVVAELRQPSVINSTTGVVTSWRVLGSAMMSINQNFTGTASVGRVLTLAIASPQSNGAGDLLVPESSVAFNGVADMVVFEHQGNASIASPQTVSLADSATYYQSELSTVISSSSWVTYQLLAGLVVAVLLVRSRSVSAVAKAPYSLELRKFKSERVLARLEELRRSSKMSQQRFDELIREHRRKSDEATPGPR